MSIIQSNRAAPKVKPVIEEIINKHHSPVVRRFCTAISFCSVKLSGLYVNSWVWLYCFASESVHLRCMMDQTFLVDKLLTITDLDPMRRYLAPNERPKPNSRYSSIQVKAVVWLYSDWIVVGAGFVTLSVHTQYPEAAENFPVWYRGRQETRQ